MRKIKDMFSDRTEIKNNIIISIGYAFILGFFAPLDFLYSNIDDLWMDIYNIIKGVAVVSFATLIVVLLVLFLGDIISLRVVKIGYAIKFCAIYALISFYVQGNYIRVPYGALDGTPIVWNEYLFEDITSIVAWVGILMLLIILAVKKGWNYFCKVGGIIVLSIIAIATVTLIYEYLFSYGLKNKVGKMSTDKNEWVYSNNENVNILLLDYFDSRLMTELLLDDEQVSEMTEDFDGFTFFRDTLGCYNLTDYAIPVALTGKLYLGSITYGEYADKAYSSSMVFDRLNREGWNTNIYTTITLPQGDVVDSFSNVRSMHLKPIYDTKLIEDYYGIVAFRYAPTPCKRFFYDYFREVGANRMADSSYLDKDDENTISDYNWNNIVWYNGCMGDYDMIDTNVFHFYHLHGVHPPRQYFSDFKFTTNPDEVSLEEGAKLGVIIAHDWINRLKEEGIYDNSIIIIMADHGSWEYEDGYHLSQTPLLMIKGYDEHHDFCINEDIPVSYLDIQQAIMRLMDGSFSIDCFDDMLVNTELYAKTDKYCMSIDELKRSVQLNKSIESTGRIRPYFFIYLMNEMGTDSVGGPFFEGYTEYPAYEPDYMIKTGVEYK